MPQAAWRKVWDEMKLRRWGLFGLWILSLAAISSFGGAVSYGLFFAVTLLPLVSFVYLVCVYFRFKIYQKVESRNMVCGQPMPYFFVLQNDDYFAFSSVSVRMFSSFSYVEDMPEDTEYELLPGDKFTYETKLVCKYRGEYEVGVKEIIITDFFRLFRLRYPVPGAIRALVLPKLVRLQEPGSIADLSVYLQREAFLRKTEPDVVVRDYVEGDSIRQIHWKATARERKLKVRNRTGEEKQGIVLFCDTKRYTTDMREYLPVENKLLEVLLALGCFFAEKSVPYTVYFDQNGPVKTQVSGMQDFDNFYQKTAELIFQEKEGLDALLGKVAAQGALLGSRVVFLVLSCLNSGIMKLTEQIAAGGVIVVIYLVTDDPADAYVRQSNPRRRIFILSTEAVLEEEM